MQKKFRWLPCHNDMIRTNFEKRGSSKMTQLFQELRKNLDHKPDWIGDTVWREMKAYWQSPEFLAKSVQNKKNRDSCAGASLHTGGSIPHRIHWKRMVLLFLFFSFCRLYHYIISNLSNISLFLINYRRLRMGQHLHFQNFIFVLIEERRIRVGWVQKLKVLM